jgi:ATP-dependent protease ClpP protease subunit
MFHDVSLEDSGGKSEEVKIVSKETDRLNRKVWRIMEKNINQPEGYLWDMVHARGRTDWYMTGKEAVRHNIANHVRIPNLHTTVTVTMALK